jgi:hypothetical protein
MNKSGALGGTKESKGLRDCLIIHTWLEYLFWNWARKACLALRNFLRAYVVGGKHPLSKTRNAKKKPLTKPLLF